METNSPARVIPWEEVVKLKQERDHQLLNTIEHYRVISEADYVAEPSRVEAKKLMKKYQNIYLGMDGGTERRRS